MKMDCPKSSIRHPFILWFSAAGIAFLPVLALTEWSRGFSLIDNGFAILSIVPASPMLYLALFLPQIADLWVEWIIWGVVVLAWILYVSAIYWGLVLASRRNRWRILSALGVIIAALVVYGFCSLILVDFFKRGFFFKLF